jgi:uncharacterized membrane protein
MESELTRGIVVKGELPDVFALWEDFARFPEFMRYIRSVVKTGENTSHWVMEGFLGRDLEWDALTTEIRPNERIAWRSLGGHIHTTGRVEFCTPQPGMTQVTATIAYQPPQGKLGQLLSRFFHEPQRRLEEDLENFKEYAELVLQQTSPT